MAVYIYARQSSGDDDKSISVDQQIENCKRLAAENRLNVNEVYQDLNTSGRLYWAGGEYLAQKDVVYQDWVKETKKKNKYRIGLGKLFSNLNTCSEKSQVSL